MLSWDYWIETVNLEYQMDDEGHMKSPPWSSEEILLKLLRDMGKDGWELAAFVPAQPERHSELGTMRNAWLFHAVFKRPGAELER